MMSSDLQAIMQRRREKTDSGIVSSTANILHDDPATITTMKPLISPTTAMNKDLQAIMERRRQLSDNNIQPLPPHHHHFTEDDGDDGDGDDVPNNENAYYTPTIRRNTKDFCAIRKQHDLHPPMIQTSMSESEAIRPRDFDDDVIPNSSTYNDYLQPNTYLYTNNTLSPPNVNTYSTNTNPSRQGSGSGDHKRQGSSSSSRQNKGSSSGRSGRGGGRGTRPTSGGDPSGGGASGDGDGGGDDDNDDGDDRSSASSNHPSDDEDNSNDDDDDNEDGEDDGGDDDNKKKERKPNRERSGGNKSSDNEDNPRQPTRHRNHRSASQSSKDHRRIKSGGSLGTKSSNSDGTNNKEESQQQQTGGGALTTASGSALQSKLGSSRPRRTGARSVAGGSRAVGRSADGSKRRNYSRQDTGQSATSSASRRNSNDGNSSTGGSGASRRPSNDAGTGGGASRRNSNDGGTGGGASRRNSNDGGSAPASRRNSNDGNSSTLVPTIQERDPDNKESEGNDSSNNNNDNKMKGSDHGNSNRNALPPKNSVAATLANAPQRKLRPDSKSVGSKESKGSRGSKGSMGSKDSKGGESATSASKDRERRKETASSDSSGGGGGGSSDKVDTNYDDPLATQKSSHTDASENTFTSFASDTFSNASDSGAGGRGTDNVEHLKQLDISAPKPNRSNNTGAALTFAAFSNAFNDDIPETDEMNTPTNNNNSNLFETSDSMFGSTSSNFTDQTFTPTADSNNNSNANNSLSTPSGNDPFDAPQSFSGFDANNAMTPSAFDLQTNSTFQSPPTFDTAAFEPSTFTPFGATASAADTPMSSQSFGNNMFLSVPKVPPDPIEALMYQPNNKQYDKSPLKNPPQRTIPNKFQLMKRNTFSHNFKCSPVVNPLNGNIIFVGENTKKDICIYEIDPKRNNLQVLSSPILTSDMHKKVTGKYGMAALGVDGVFKLAVGVHRSHGQARIRVLAVLDLLVLDSRQILRIIAVWQWGYGTTQPVAIQHILTPPSGTDYVYDADSICAADNIVFVAGGSAAKGPCVFICKPSVRESWSANFLGATANNANPLNNKISTLATTPDIDRKYPYLAISLVDGTVSVWTYAAALHATHKKGEPIRKLLFPLCRLEGIWILSNVEPVQISGSNIVDSSDTPSTDKKSNSKEVGYCTHLEWMQPQPTLSSPLFLAASFHGGVAVFHVSLPVKADPTTGSFKPPPEPTQATTLPQTPQVWPFSAIRWKGLQEKAFVSWSDFGPHANLCLSILIHDKPTVGTDNNESTTAPEVGRIILGSINIPQYRKGFVRPKTSLAPFRILGSLGLKSKKGKANFPLGLLGTSSLRSIICHHKSGIFTLSPSLSNSMTGRREADPYIMSLGHAISSNPPGLNSNGEVICTDSSYDSKKAAHNKEGTLHILTLTQCDRIKNENSDAASKIFIWGCPTYRHFLCCTMPGDSKDSQGEETKEERSVGGLSNDFGENDETTVCGGGSSDIICDLSIEKLAGLVPCRIVRCPGISITAVLFRPALGNLAGIALDCVSIAMVDYRRSSATVLSTKPTIEILEGRDVVFLPREGENTVRAVVLSRDGSSLSLYNYQATKWKITGTSYRPILGVDSDEKDKFIECIRIFMVRSSTNKKRFGFVMVGRKTSDNNKNCIIRGPLVDLDKIVPASGNLDQKDDNKDDDGWSKMLPEIDVENRLFWLNDEEAAFSLIGLPPISLGSSDKKEKTIKKETNIALVTSNRVVIISPELKVLAEMTTVVSSTSLAPIGSCTVSFSTIDGKIRYLSCLHKRFSIGIISNLPLPECGYCPYLLTAIRPDRFLYLPWHSSCHLVEQDQNPDSFFIPLVVTRPALLLEPMVANAVSERTAAAGEKGPEGSSSTPLLRSVVEKFGRKVKTMTHPDDEGVGLLGAGLTPRVYEILSHYGLKHPASWLLTGNIPFDRKANSKILTPWMPISAKAEAALNADSWLHLLANGDQYLIDYVKSPDESMSSTLPRPSDPTGYLCREFARESLANGNPADAIKLLDLAGTESTDSMLFQLALLLEMNQSADVIDLLKALCGYDDKFNARSGSSSSITANASLAALAVSLKKTKLTTNAPVMSDDHILRWMKPLAPSLQRGTTFGRIRQRMLGEGILAKAGGGGNGGGGLFDNNKIAEDRHFQSPCIETRHVWNEGPNKEKENLLLLDRVEDWLGRRRPAVLGKEGAEDAQNRGETTLANIINKASGWDDDEEEEEKSAEESENQNWAEGVGEARDDEDNLSAYFRFSEGEDEDSPWRGEGFTDLSRYQNKAVLVGNSDSFDIQASSSSVDEGEQGKAWTLHDLIFEAAGGDEPSGLAIPAIRGNSLDVGILHGKDRDNRSRCTIEFWYFLPPADTVKGPIVLARRSMGPSANDLQKVCVASEKDSVLWELILLQSGELQFRTCGGTKMISKQQKPDVESSGIGAIEAFAVDTGGYDEEQKEERNDVVTWERWNHVCMTFSSRGVQRVTDCIVSLYMKGTNVGSATVSMAPPGLKGESVSVSKLDELMSKSHLIFGLNHAAYFRLTEIRVWACERSEDDLRMMMYEYLKAAEKRRFKVKIKGKNKGGKTKGVGSLAPPKGGLAPPKGGAFLTPPKGSVGLAPPKGSGGLAPPKGSGFLAPPKGPARLVPPKSMLASPTDSEESTPAATSQPIRGLLMPPPSRDEPTSVTESFSPSAFGSGFGTPDATFNSPPAVAFNTAANEFKKPFGSFDDKTGSDMSFASPQSVSQEVASQPSAEQGTPNPGGTPDPAGTPNQGATPPPGGGPSNPEATSFGASPADSTASTLWDRSSPLSQQVRHSAAAALIRGPPATRHFGGNRGGLLDLRGKKRACVGGIAICGSEKTIVWRDQSDPPALTYPIGASGAIVSDRQDVGDNGSEFLCCFLAKEKRMVVFELHTRTVVVELQMTTKLNFWRYLPPEACENGLCFMLVTPVGGFHWMPLDDSPRPRQVWKRGQDLQGKKIVSYEEGGTNGKHGDKIMSTVGLICVTSPNTNFCLEAWIIPICGDSLPVLASNETLGAALCRPVVPANRFLPNLVATFEAEDGILLSVNTIIEPNIGSVDVGDIIATVVIDLKRYKNVSHAPPTLAMGMFPEAIVCSLGNLISVIMRRKGLMTAYELEKDGLHLVAEEDVGHFVVDAVMRCSESEGGAEIMMLLSDPDNPKDGRVVSYNFRSSI